MASSVPPDSGLSTEDGGGEGRGFNINIPLPPGTGDYSYLKASGTLSWSRLPASSHQSLYCFQPAMMRTNKIQLVGNVFLRQDIVCFPQRIAAMGEANNAPVVAFLEGGYNAQALAECVVDTNARAELS